MHIALRPVLTCNEISFRGRCVFFSFWGDESVKYPSTYKLLLLNYYYYVFRFDFCFSCPRSASALAILHSQPSAHADTENYAFFPGLHRPFVDLDLRSRFFHFHNRRLSVKRVLRKGYCCFHTCPQITIRVKSCFTCPRLGEIYMWDSFYQFQNIQIFVIWKLYSNICKICKLSSIA